MLTHINTYFKFLFINNLSPVLPTLSIKGRKRTVNKATDLAWTEKLAEYLVDDNLSLYTRMTLLLISHFYTIKEILQRDFYQELNQIEFTEDRKSTRLNSSHDSLSLHDALPICFDYSIY